MVLNASGLFSTVFLGSGVTCESNCWVLLSLRCLSMVVPNSRWFLTDLYSCSCFFVLVSGLI